MNPMILGVLVLLVAVGYAGAESYQYDFDGDTEFRLSIGTPPQTHRYHFDVSLSRYGYHRVATARRLFRTQASSTWRFRDDIGDGVTGTDWIRLYNGAALPDMNLDVYGYYWGKGWVDLGPSPHDEPSFMDRVLEELGGDKTVVVAFKKAGKEDISGRVILGDGHPDVCANVYTQYATQSTTFFQMAFNSTGVEIGKYQSAEKIPMVFNNDAILLDDATYRAAVQQLSIGPKKELPCSTNTGIRISAGPLSWELRPQHYMSRRAGRCFFDANKATEIALPLEFLSGKCLRYNFAQKTVAVGPIVPPE